MFFTHSFSLTVSTCTIELIVVEVRGVSVMIGYNSSYLCVDMCCGSHPSCLIWKDCSDEGLQLMFFLFLSFFLIVLLYYFMVSGNELFDN